MVDQMNLEIEFLPAVGNYGANKKGHIINLKTGKILKDAKHTGGYRCINLRIQNKYRTFLVHRLVAMAFLGMPEKGIQVNHKNGIKTDNRLSNIEYVSQSQNIIHAKRNGLMPRATYRKLSEQQIKDIKTILEIRERNKCSLPTYRQIGIMFGISQANIYFINKRGQWS